MKIEKYPMAVEWSFSHRLVVSKAVHSSAKTKTNKQNDTMGLGSYRPPFDFSLELNK